MTLRLREARPQDEAFISEMLAEPRIADYVEAWGREGDGFLGGDVPGIGLAVGPSHRGRGIVRAGFVEVGREGDSLTMQLTVAGPRED